jgi:dihydroflavonol-4-reductase
VSAAERALVTGAAGFIGSHVVRELLAAGYRVRALVLPGDEAKNLRGLDVDVVRGDVADMASVERAVRGTDLVFHLAAIYALWAKRPERIREVNVGGTKNVLRAARAAGVRRVVHTSSIARFGGQGFGVRATEASPFALGPCGDLYANTKNEAHWVAHEAARAGQDVVIVAPCGPIGPGDVGPTPTGKLLIACTSLPVVCVVPTATCFAHVRDMGRAHVLAAERGVSGECYLLGTENLTAKDLAERALRALGLSRPILEVPFGVASAFAYGALLHTEIISRRAPVVSPAAVRVARVGLEADGSKAARELGMPRTAIDVALREAFEWFSREGYLGRRARPARSNVAAHARSN